MKKSDELYGLFFSQQQLSVLSPFHLVAVILNNNLLTNGTFDMPLSELVREVAWFKSVIETFGATVDLSGKSCNFKFIVFENSAPATQ